MSNTDNNSITESQSIDGKIGDEKLPLPWDVWCRDETVGRRIIRDGYLPSIPLRPSNLLLPCEEGQVKVKESHSGGIVMECVRRRRPRSSSIKVKGQRKV